MYKSSESNRRSSPSSAHRHIPSIDNDSLGLATQQTLVEKQLSQLTALLQANRSARLSAFRSCRGLCGGTHGLATKTDLPPSALQRSCPVTAIDRGKEGNPARFGKVFVEAAERLLGRQLRAMFSTQSK